ncbi:MAG: glycosyltransferase family 2 protein [Cyclobacteriaceae bacterium]
MKCSVITVAYNALQTLPNTIQSFQSQTYSNKEQIVVDGGSQDGSLPYLQSLDFDDLVWASKKDQGIYDAMNNGILTSTGEIVGILNADDVFYADEVIEQVMSIFIDNPELDAVYADVIFERNGKTWRHYSAKEWSPERLSWGFMPPHPGVFLRKSLFDQFGYYKTDYSIAADYELIIRLFWKHRIRSRYIPIVTANMSLGGVSTRNLNSNVILNREIKRACRENGLSTNYLKIYSKYLFKWKELL